MNIAIFDAQKYWSGGSERVFMCIEGFKKIGHNVILICLPTSRLNRLLKNKIIIYNIHPVFDLDIFSALQIFFILIKNNIQILDIHSPKFYWLGVFIGRLLNKKVFITRNVEYRKQGLKKKINKFLYKLCNGVIAVSRKVKSLLIEDFGLKDEKICVIYDRVFFNRDEFENLRDKYNLSYNEVVLSIIGRIEKNKGQDFAVDIVKELKHKGYNVKLFIIGSIEEKEYYIKILEKIKNYALSENIVFTGFVENVCDYIYTSDLILCCSLYESMGKVVAESLYLNTPVVSTSAVKINEIVPQEYLSFLNIVNRFKIEEFLQKIEKIIMEIEKYRQIKKNLRIQKRSSFLEIADEYLNFYQRCCYEK